MQHSSRNITLPELLRLVDSSLIALPEFQRPFVWEPSRVLELLDSVLNGWPIGSLLLLEGPQPFRVRKVDGAPDVFEPEVRYFLLDGQQRVTALYHALKGASRTVYYADFNDTDDDGRPKLKWIARKSSANLGLHARQVSFESLLVRDESELFMQGASAAMIEWIEETRRLFTEDADGDVYSIPAIIMDNAISLEALTRIFETLNRTGVRLNAFDLMVAVLYPSGFNLREEWDRAFAAHGILRDFNTSGLQILKLIALWQRRIDAKAGARPASRRVTGIRQRDVLNIPPDSVDEFWLPAIDAYCEALRVLRQQFGIQDGDDLPSETMVLTLAVLLKDGTALPEISWWFWSSIALQTYAQGANTQIISDLRSMQPEPISRQAVEQALKSNLVDEVRRNKILRLGLRAIMRLDKVLDAATGLPFRGPVTEVSTSFLADGKVGVDGDAPIAGLVFVSRESTQMLKKNRSEPGEMLARLNSKALSMQGLQLAIGSDGGAGVADIIRRGEYLSSMFLARLA